MTTNDIRPLAGVRVLELGNYIAAPTAGRMLADFGAEVIKVERPVTGDELRNWRLYSGDTSMLYRTINRNKKSIVLDLKTERAARSCSTSSRTATCCWRTSGPARWRSGASGPRSSTAANPDLVITRISAFGQTGPMSRTTRVRRGRRGVRRPA